MLTVPTAFMFMPFSKVLASFIDLYMEVGSKTIYCEFNPNRK